MSHGAPCEACRLAQRRCISCPSPPIPDRRRPDRGRSGAYDCLHYPVPGPLQHWVRMLYNLLLLLDEPGGVECDAAQAAPAASADAWAVL